MTFKNGPDFIYIEFEFEFLTIPLEVVQPLAPEPHVDPFSREGENTQSLPLWTWLKPLHKDVLSA